MQANLDEEVHQQHVEAGEQEGEHEGEVVALLTAQKVKRVSPRTAAAVTMAASRTTLPVDITQELHDIRHDRKNALFDVSQSIDWCMQRRNALATDNVIKNILKCLQV
jgi:SH3-like domain-containing protein